MGGSRVRFEDGWDVSWLCCIERWDDRGMLER
jgi:hypothetical protein